MKSQFNLMYSLYVIRRIIVSRIKAARRFAVYTLFRAQVIEREYNECVKRQGYYSALEHPRWGHVGFRRTDQSLKFYWR